jgi:16S rRNA (cytosine967-C5)-methyltransferase
MIVATTLRRLGQIDDLIKRAAAREEAVNPPALLTLLRLGVCQIIFMNVPDYAAIDTSVELAEKNNLSRQKGFVNAVLRQIAQNGREWIKKQDEVRLNNPEWMMKCWIADYGLRSAAEIGVANLSEAPLDISIKIESEIDYATLPEKPE